MTKVTQGILPATPTHKPIHPTDHQQEAAQTQQQEANSKADVAVSRGP